MVLVAAAAALLAGMLFYVQQPGTSGSLMDDVEDVDSAPASKWSTQVFAPTDPDPDAGTSTESSSSSGPAPEVVKVQPGPPRATSTDAPSTAAAKTGYITLGSTPWARVLLDGKRDLGTTPIYQLELPAGEHMLTLIHEASNLKKVVPVTVQPGKLVKMKVTLEP